MNASLLTLILKVAFAVCPDLLKAYEDYKAGKPISVDLEAALRDLLKTLQDALGSK